MRVLIGEYWTAGKVIACWTSEAPGRTGPADLVRTNGWRARWWWKPWLVRWAVSRHRLWGFWCYRWARR